MRRQRSTDTHAVPVAVATTRFGIQRGGVSYSLRYGMISMSGGMGGICLLFLLILWITSKCYGNPEPWVRPDMKNSIPIKVQCSIRHLMTMKFLRLLRKRNFISRGRAPFKHYHLHSEDQARRSRYEGGQMKKYQMSWGGHFMKYPKVLGHQDQPPTQIFGNVQHGMLRNFEMEKMDINFRWYLVKRTKKGHMGMCKHRCPTFPVIPSILIPLTPNMSSTHIS